MADHCESRRVFVYAVREVGVRVALALQKAKLDAAEVVVKCTHRRGQGMWWCLSARAESRCGSSTDS